MKKIVCMLTLFLVLALAASGVVSVAGEQTGKAGAGEAICDGPGGACIIADFIGSPTDGVAPLRVQFLDSSTGYPAMWAWDFGDGKVVSGTANPVHVYREPGIYTVTLTATSLTGASSTKVRQQYIIVRDKRPLEADFLANPTYGKAPLTVQFTDCSKGAVQEWRWDFGDGGTAYEQNPIYVYKRPGKYTVTLTVSSPTAGSSTKVKEKYIIVEPSCIIEARFSADPASGTAPLKVKYTDLSVGGPTMWAWDFGDGTTDMVANPVHVYKNPGTYQVRLTASSQLCEPGISETTIKVNPPAIKADFSADPQSGEVPLTVQFTDLSTGNPTMWEWDFGDGNIIPASEDGELFSDDDEVACDGGRCPPPNKMQNPRHTYRVPGTYAVTLTASNKYSSDTVTKTQYVTVTPKAIKADFSAEPRTGDAPLTVRFTDLSTGNPTMWAWDFGDGATDMVANPVHVYTQPGTYTVTLTASNQYTSDTVRKDQWITAKDVSINADFVGTPTSGYAPLTVQFTDLSTGNPTRWEWNFGDRNIIPAGEEGELFSEEEEDEVACDGGRCPPPEKRQNPRHTYRFPGTYTVTLTASNQYGTSDTEVKQGYITVSANAIVADFDGSPRSGCAPLTVQFTDMSSDSPTRWEWDFGDRNIIPAGEGGELFSEEEEDEVACDGGRCPPPEKRQNPRHTYRVPGTYTVTLTASNQYGGTGTVTKQGFITVESCPPVRADFDGTPRSGDIPLSVRFTDLSTGNPTMWAWDFGDGATDMVANPVHIYDREGKYTVTLTASNRYGSDTISKSEFISVNTPYDDEIPISGGWNFISVPKKLAPGYDTASIFKVVDSGGHSMFQYDTGKHLWHVLDPSSPIKPLEGFWIYSKGTSKVPLRYDTNPVQTPPTAYLKKGWNGIGFTGKTPIEAKFTLLSVEDKWVNCAGFNAQIQQYDQMIIKGSNDGTLMYPFRGYWLYMTADGVLAANAA
ncbi:PKD domain-containing protein [Methanospirillum sp.]|uniref:PKD domain-containing protein n=1 Tax=Methanospirillum sp. TaxID=45200 RepID=UPI00261ADB4D|nr:PKD domain-containing protein [Methanospirillum sp.]